MIERFKYLLYKNISSILDFLKFSLCNMKQVLLIVRTCVRTCLISSRVVGLSERYLAVT